MLQLEKVGVVGAGMMGSQIAQNSLSLSVHEMLHHAFGERSPPRPLLRQRAAAGCNGRDWRRYDARGDRL